MAPVPKHRLIEEDMLAEIENGGLAVGEQIATAEEICDKYGVSRPTADKAIISLASRGYVERTQGRGTFVKDWQGWRVDKRQMDVISVLCSNQDLKNVRFCADFVHYASLAAEKRGYHLVFCALSDEQDYCAPLVIRNRQAQGNLVLGMPSEEQMKVLLAEKVGHLFIANHRKTFGQPSVRHDMEDAGYQVTKALGSLQRGPVWMVIEPTRLVYYAQELLDGYQRALQGQPRPSYHVYMSSETVDPGDYEELTAQLLASRADHFCMMVSHLHVRPLMEQLERAGIGAEQTTIVVLDRYERDWPYGERLCLCEMSPALLADESVRQIVAAADKGSAMPGKIYKLQYERTDDRRKPLRFSWI